MAFTPNLIQIDQIQSPQDLFNFCRDELILGVKKSKHPFHLCTFCTVIDGRPSARTVVSRGVNDCLTQCRIHSDKRSQKNRHILESPNVALLYYSQPQKLQIRFEGHAHAIANKVDEDFFLIRLPRIHSYAMPFPALQELSLKIKPKNDFILKSPFMNLMPTGTMLGTTFPPLS